MKLIHLSDIHLADEGKSIWGVNPKERLDYTINKISQIKDVDAIIISGDLSNDGSAWSYEYIDYCFAKLNIPTYCCVGNHDSKDQMISILSFIKVEPITFIDDWKIVFVDSTIKGKGKGYVDEKELSFLKKEISEYSENIIVVLHHPPLPSGGWCNKKVLINHDEVREMLTASKNVRLILYGHIHSFTQEEINGVIYHSTSSTYYAYNKDLQQYVKADGEEGFSIITIKEGSVLIECIKFN